MAVYREEDFSIQFWNGGREAEHMHQDVEFLFVIDGKLTVSMLEKRFVMGPEDMLVINSNHRHGLCADGPVHVCIIHFNYSMLLNYQDQKLLFFYCNSMVEKHEKYGGLRAIMGDLLSECAVNMDKMTFMKKSQVYRLLHFLVQYFMSDRITDHAGSDDIRVEKMLQYINTNYNKLLTLTEMAEFMYMAPSSFSRYFKKRVGITFIEYVNNVRLHFALEDVRYTDKSISRIAQDHGFTNSSAFCRAFKEAYQISPMLYRKQEALTKKESRPAQMDRQFLKKYLKENETAVWHPWKKRNIEVRADAAASDCFENPWGQAVNLGIAHMLLSAVLQKQILFAKQEIGFTWGRIFGLFSEKMELRPRHEAGILNFDSLDIIFDFLVENHIRPVICLDNKPTSILKSVNEDLVEIGSEKIFDSIEECIGVLDDFLRHVISRYGVQAVDGWIFECWYNEYYENTMGIPGSFPRHFTKIYQCIRSRLDSALIGGCGLSTAISEEKFSGLLEQWRAEPAAPDFISIYLLPYARADIDGKLHAKRRLNMDYVMEDIVSCQTLLEKAGWGGLPLYVLEWNLSLSQRNYFNDSCGKAALMAAQMCRMTGRLSFAAYGGISDLSSSYYDSDRLLIGASGLICRSGICKPSFYALKFMSMLEPRLIGCYEHCVITTNGRASYSIFCFNHKRLRYNYYIKDEYDIGLEEVKTIFEDDDWLDITFTLENVEDGSYTVREYGISPEKGSVLTQWQSLGTGEPLSLENIRYLKNICVPYQKNGHIKAAGGKLTFLKTLKAHEIRLIKIVKTL